MALAETTLSVAVAATDNVINVASATSVAAGRIVQVDGELMKVGHGYSSGTEIPVLRGWDGTKVAAHVASARVVHGAPVDFAAKAAGQSVLYPPAGRAREVKSITADNSTCPLPAPGSDLLVVLNGTSVINLTVPVPTKDLDGSELVIAGNGAAAHVITFTGGLSGAGTSYDVLTVNATAPVAMKFVAINELWYAYAQIPISGTVTNVTAGLA